MTTPTLTSFAKGRLCTAGPFHRRGAAPRESDAPGGLALHSQPVRWARSSAPPNPHLTPPGGAAVLGAARRQAGFHGRLRMALAAAFLSLSIPALSAEAQPTVADPALESRVLKLSEVLRCLVCQNQSIAESNAELAQDLRGQVREQLAAGKSEKEVVDYMVARYGDFVLYQPPVKPTTLPLWAGPGLLLAAGVAWLGWRLKSRRRESAPELSPEEHARARALLEGQGEEGTERNEGREGSQ